MEDHQILSQLSDNDVLSFKKSQRQDHVTKVSAFKAAIKNVLLSCRKLESLLETELVTPLKLEVGMGWLGEGISCEVLRLGSRAWKTGKIRIRISVDFYPDEPEIELDSGSNNNQAEPVIEFPLDDVRKSISNL